jgi:hypothetical protein
MRMPWELDENTLKTGGKKKKPFHYAPKLKKENQSLLISLFIDFIKFLYLQSGLSPFKTGTNTPL